MERVAGGSGAYEAEGSLESCPQELMIMAMDLAVGLGLRKRWKVNGKVEDKRAL